MQKNLWPEVVKLLSPSSDVCTGALRTLMRFYVKFLLPYECHVRHDTVSNCLSKVDTSIFMHTVFSNEIEAKGDARGLDVEAETVQGRKVNGEAHSNSESNSRRLNSQTSDSSAGDNSNQENLMTECRGKEDIHPSDIPEDSQTTSVDSYPQEVSSDEPLPEISAQETETLLAMPASPSPQPPVTTVVPTTPSAEPATPPSSFPPPYPPQVSQDWGQNTDMFAGYPSYPMDMPSYRSSHVAPIPPGYNPFGPPSQHDISMDYHMDMSSPMMRSPYENTPYHIGVPPVMHGSPTSRPNPYHLYRSHMMPRDPFSMRNSDVPYPTVPGVSSEWAWQQGSHFSGMMHHHPMLPPRSNQGLQSLPRVHLLQPSSHPSSHHRSSANQSPGPGGEVSKQQWQDHSKGKSIDRGLSSSRSKPDLKGSTKSEHSQMLDSLKRPLPDWSCCVEGTKPQLAKRKHLLSVDCGKCCSSRLVVG